MSSFFERSDSDLYELAQRDPDALFAHAMSARAWARHEYAKRALQILAFSYEEKLVSFIAVKASMADAIEIARQALEDAYRASFDGSSAAEFRALLFVIASRRRADHYRKGQIEAGPLVEEHGDDESIWGENPSVEHEVGLIGLLELIGITAEEDLTKEGHARVIQLCLILDYDSDTTAQMVNQENPGLDPPMTAQNVDTIKSRFRKALRERLEDNESDADG